MATTSKQDTRCITFIPKEVGDILVKQIENEHENEALYRNFSLWSSARSLTGQAEYFEKRRKEERTHADWIIQWLDQGGFDFELPPVSAMPVEITPDDNTVKECEQMHLTILEREIETTDAIKKIHETCTQHKDWLTQQWLSRLLLEQAEEEDLSHRAIDACHYSTDMLEIENHFIKVINPSF
jgi:ferritin